MRRYGQARNVKDPLQKKKRRPNRGRDHPYNDHRDRRVEHHCGRDFPHSVPARVTFVLQPFVSKKWKQRFARPRFRCYVITRHVPVFPDLPGLPEDPVEPAFAWWLRELLPREAPYQTRRMARDIQHHAIAVHPQDAPRLGRIVAGGDVLVEIGPRRTDRRTGGEQEQACHRSQEDCPHRRFFPLAPRQASWGSAGSSLCSIGLFSLPWLASDTGGLVISSREPASRWRRFRRGYGRRGHRRPPAQPSSRSLCPCRP